MSGIPLLVVLSVMEVLINLLMRSSIVASCTEVSMGISTGALVVMVGAVGTGVAGVTGGAEVASKPETANSSLDWTVKSASLGPDTMGCVLLDLGPIRKLGGEREKLLIL